MSLHTYLDQGLTILRTQLSNRPLTRPASEQAVKPFITLSRETCAGAATLGRTLLPMLNRDFGEEGRSWMFLDKDLLTRALSQGRLPEHLADYLPEDRVSETKALIGELVGLHPPIWQLEQQVFEAIVQLARLGRVILAGRGGHLLTRDLTGGLHVRLVASFETRVHRHMAVEHCDKTQAESAVRKSDIARRRFVRTNFEQDIDDPHAYDLVINTDRIGPETAARLVITALHESLATPQTASAAKA
ncbi:MAG: cytidylate kinase-like family protein [Opitutae bacterium]|nr:cytidylate kinase-like family protein [Opitutae bacterium]